MLRLIVIDSFAILGGADRGNSLSTSFRSVDELAQWLAKAVPPSTSVEVWWAGSDLSTTTLAIPGDRPALIRPTLAEEHPEWESDDRHWSYEHLETRRGEMGVRVWRETSPWIYTLDDALRVKGACRLGRVLPLVAVVSARSRAAGARRGATIMLELPRGILAVSESRVGEVRWELLRGSATGGWLAQLEQFEPSLSSPHADANTLGRRRWRIETGWGTDGGPKLQTVLTDEAGWSSLPAPEITQGKAPGVATSVDLFEAIDPSRRVTAILGVFASVLAAACLIFGAVAWNAEAQWKERQSALRQELASAKAVAAKTQALVGERANLDRLLADLEGTLDVAPLELVQKLAGQIPRDVSLNRLLWKGDGNFVAEAKMWQVTNSANQRPWAKSVSDTLASTLGLSRDRIESSWDEQQRLQRWQVAPAATITSRP